MTDFLFVFVQSAVQKFPPADGYAFNTSCPRMQILDQDAAMAAFKHAVSRR